MKLLWTTRHYCCFRTGMSREACRAQEGFLGLTKWQSKLMVGVWRESCQLSEVTEAMQCGNTSPPRSSCRPPHAEQSWRKPIASSFPSVVSCGPGLGHCHGHTAYPAMETLHLSEKWAEVGGVALEDWNCLCSQTVYRQEGLASAGRVKQESARTVSQL